MSDLDDKILKAVLGKGLPDGMPIPNFVNKIKEAFADGGYMLYKETPQAYQDKVSAGRMTGQEWYERFCKELTGVKKPQTRVNFVHTESSIFEAARRAAGIGHD